MNIPTILDQATQTQWEIFIQRSRRTDIQLRQSKLEALIDQENSGYGIRIIAPRADGAGVGFASCNSEKEIASTATKAYDLAKVNRSPSFSLPKRTKLPRVQTVDPKIWRDQSGTAEDYAEAAQALISDEKEISLTFGKVRTYAVENEVINSNGLSYSSKGTYVYLEMTFKIGTRSNPTEYWPNRYARRISDVDPEKIVPQWMGIAKSCLRRHPPRTKETAVIFSPAVVCDTFLPAIGFHASGEAVKQNLSQFEKGGKVASEDLTVVDDGLYPFGLRTNPFDDEGHPQQRTKLLQNGVFRNYIYDRLNAQTLGFHPTGNGIRARGFPVDVDERYQLPPSNAPTNLSIKPGTKSLEDLIKDVKEGIIIYQCAWINPDEITTRFGSEIRNAQEIVNGELGTGIVGGTLSGATLDLIHKISGISNRAEIVSGYSFGCVAPYIRFEGVQISGPA